MRLSIAYKFLIPTLIVATTGTLINSWITYRNAAQVIIDQHERWIAQMLESTAKTTESWIEERNREVSSWSTYKSIILATGDGYIAKTARKSVTQTLKGMVQEYPHVYAIEIADTHNHIIVRSSDEENEQLVDNSYYQSAINGKVTQSEVNEIEGHDIFKIYSPLNSNNEGVVGVLIVSIDFSYFGTQYIDTIRLGDLGFSYLMDEKGKIVYQSRNLIDLFGNRSNSIPIENLSKKNSIGLEGNITGRRKHINIINIPNLSWNLIIEADYYELLDGPRKMGVTILILSSATILVITIFLFMLGHYVGKPAKSLAKMINEIHETGNLSFRMDVNSRDEIGYAVATFYSFMDDLSSAVKQINHAMGLLAREEPSIPLDIELRGDLKYLKESINSSIASVSRRTAELREKNTNIQAMLENMRQGLFTIDTSGKIHPEYSRYLEDIFETNTIAGTRAEELLFRQSKLDSDILDQVENAIKYVIGENQLNFMFNSHVLVSELEVQINDKTKYIALDWNPILEEDTVERLMVSVRDVTALKVLESESESKKRELDIVSQLLNMKASKFISFCESTRNFIEECRSILQSTPQKSDKPIEDIFRKLHTIKGNCRTYSFTYLSNVVHNAETVYSDLKQNSDIKWNVNNLLNDLENIYDVLNEYEFVYKQVLGRDNTERDSEGVWLSQNDLDVIADSAKEISNNGAIDSNSIALCKKIDFIIEKSNSSTLEECISDEVNALHSVAANLKKPTPDVKFDMKNFRITKRGYSLVCDIFPHLLSNCIDHGIEDERTRISMGKPPKGTINICAFSTKEKRGIKVFDDGQGLNLKILFNKGSHKGKWSSDFPPTFSDLASSIFDSGISTAISVTSISGRGVGLDAVKQFLIAKGGDISINVRNPGELYNPETSPNFLAFIFEIILPNDILIDYV